MKKTKSLPVTIYIILRIIVLLILIRSLIRGDYEGVFYCVLTLILFILPNILKRSFKIYLPSALEIIIFSFIFSAEILGELGAYYITFPFFDTILHIINGFICAAIGFGLVDLLNRGGKKISLSPIYLCIVAFCFSMTIGVLWEFFEYGMDILFMSDMQKDTYLTTINSIKLNPNGLNSPVKIDNITSVVVNGYALGAYLDIGLHDTMKDLIVNFLGAITFCIIGYFSLIGKTRGKVVKQLVPTADDDKIS